MDIITLALAKKFAKEYTDTHASKITEEDAIQAVANYFNENPNAIVTNDELENILQNYITSQDIKYLEQLVPINTPKVGQVLKVSTLDSEGNFTCAWGESNVLNTTTRIKITVTPVTEVTIILTNTSTGDSYSGFTDKNGIAEIEVNSFGSFNIVYQSAGTINAIKTIDITTPGQTYEIFATYSTSKTYTVKINLLNSNPLTCIEYQDDALGMTKGASSWDDELIFKDIKPCIFKDGKVIYYLNKNNFTQKADGTIANLTGVDGDVMIEFPKFAYRIYKDTENGKKDLYVSITNNLTAEGYHTYAFSREAEGDRDFFYWGAYKGSLNSEGNLQSVINMMPANNKTIGTFKQLAKNRGEGYTITSYFQLVAIQCLYLIKYGNLNGQSAIGNGVSNTSAAIATGGIEDKGMFYGVTSNANTHVKVFGIEDFWANIWEWIDGLTTNSIREIVTNWDYDKNTGNEDFVTPSGLTANTSGWVKDVAGTTEAGFMNVAYSGSSTTYFCDTGSLCSGCVLRFGGRWDYGDYCGPFDLYAGDAASAAYASVGARLMYL